DVLAEPGRRDDGFDDPAVDAGWIAVEQADPADSVNGRKLAKQFGKHRPAVEIVAVLRRILGDEVQLFHALLCQPRGLFENLFNRFAGVRPAKRGDRAEGALVIAAFADFKIGGPGGGGPYASTDIDPAMVWLLVDLENLKTA